MKNRVTHYKVIEQADGRFAVDAVTKEYGSMGPDPGREVDRETIVEDVDRDYGEMLARELTKQDHDWIFRDNTFSIAKTVGRQIDMWVGPNADAWAERLNSPIVF